MLIKCDDCLLLDEDDNEEYCKLNCEVHDLYIYGNKRKKGEYKEKWVISFNCKLSEIRYYDGIAMTKKPVYIGRAELEYCEEGCGTFRTSKTPEMSKYYNKEG